MTVIVGEILNYWQYLELLMKCMISQLTVS